MNNVFNLILPKDNKLFTRQVTGQLFHRWMFLVYWIVNVGLNPVTGASVKPTEAMARALL